jgi:hypothetical protein
MTMMTTSPRLRIDLKATPIEDTDGVLYYDVSDPKTGSVLRLFDFEWSLAQRLDGQHSFEDLVRYTEEHLGFSTSRDDLEVYAERLQQLGLVEKGQGAIAPASAKPVTSAQQEQLLAAPLPELPPRAIERPAEPRRADAEPIRTPLPPSGAADSDDGLMGRPVIALPKPQAQPVAAKPAPAATTPAPSKVSAKPAVELPRSPLKEALEGLPTPAADEEPAASSPPAPKPAAPAEKASEVMAAVAALSSQPTALLEQVAKPAEAAAPAQTAGGASAPAASPSETTPVKTPAATPAPVTAQELPSAQTPVKAPQPEQSPTAPTPGPTPAKPKEAPEAPTAPAKPAESQSAATKPSSQPQPSGGGGGMWVLLLLILAAAAGAAYYFLVYKPKLPPPALGVQVSVAKVEDVPRMFPSPAEVKKSEPHVLKVESEGKVAKVAAEKDEVTAETPLVVLDTQAKLEKEQADLHLRIEQLQKKSETAKGKAKQDLDTKLGEKQTRLGEIESLLKKTQILAVRPGVVTGVLIKVGDAVQTDADAVAVADKALSAELKVPALEAQGMKVGQEAKLLNGTDKNSPPITAQIIGMKSEGDFTTLTFSLPLDTSAKPGDKLQLQRGMLEKVVRVPASALVEGNKVYIAAEGKAVLRQITVADRDGDSVLLQGLANGDQIISDHAAELHEGLPIAVQAPAPVLAPAPAPAPAK